MAADSAPEGTASPPASVRYPTRGPGVLVNNGVTRTDEAGPDIFKKVKDGARIRLYDGGVYAGDRRLVRGTERTEHDDVAGADPAQQSVDVPVDAGGADDSGPVGVSGKQA